MKRADETRARILDAAEALLVSGGAAALTLRGAAKEAGIALGNLQYHYASLDALLSAVLSRVLSRGAERVAGSPGGRGAAVDALLADHDDARLVRLFVELWALAAARPELRPPMVAFYDAYAAALAAGLVALGLPRRRADVRARLMIALLEGLALFRSGVCGERRADVDAAARALLIDWTTRPATRGSARARARTRTRR